MIEERKNLKYDIDTLTEYYYGSRKNYQILKEVNLFIQSEKDFHFNPNNLSKSREEQMIHCIQLSKKMYSRFSYHNEEHLTYCGLHFPYTPMAMIHFSMFIPTLQNFCTVKQKKFWIKKAENFEISGAYAQTEMGHGSDVFNLQTTATYNRETEQFVVNTPTVKDTKWWPGEIGLFATHVVTHAQIIIDNQNYGIGTFIIQIRDLETYEPLEGIEVGDMGTKIGWNTKDNGYLRFNQIKVTREALLMKYVKVTKAGEFKKKSNDKIAYAIMLKTRIKIIYNVPVQLSKAITIATRYSLVRTQFKKNDDEEHLILDYQCQKDKIIPIIAQCYVYKKSSVNIQQIFERCMELVQKQDFSLLKEIHAIACAAKAVMTTGMVQSLEVCRRACGGHGFLDSARFNEIYNNVSAIPVFEGDNTIMHLQTARFLIKSYQNVGKKKLSVFVSFLSQEVMPVEISSLKELINTENIRQFLMFSSKISTKNAFEKMKKGVENGMSFKESWNNYSGIELIRASVAYINFFIYDSFFKTIVQIYDENVRSLLQKIALIYGIQTIIKDPLELLEENVITPKVLEQMQQVYEQILEEIRPDSIGLVDAFQLSDNCVTALGVYDGQVYPTLVKYFKGPNTLNENRKELQKGILNELRPKL